MRTVALLLAATGFAHAQAPSLPAPSSAPSSGQLVANFQSAMNAALSAGQPPPTPAQARIAELAARGQILGIQLPQH